MKLLFKQRLFSWFGRYDIYDETGDTVFQVEGRPAWGHRLELFDISGQYLGQLREKIFRLMPSYEIYLGDHMIGEIQKQITFLRPAYRLTFNGWMVKGSVLEWDYEVLDAAGRQVMQASKEVLRLADTYVIDVDDPENALLAAMIVLAIDADKAGR